MKLHYTGKNNLEITPALKAHADEKFSHIDAKFKNITNVYVVFTIERNDQVAEATVHINGIEVHATATSNDMYHSIDGIAEKITAQLIKHKEKAADHHQ